MSYGGYEDKGEVGSGGSFKFGLNRGVFGTIEWNMLAGKDNTPGEACDIIISSSPGSESFKKLRLFPITKVYGKNKEEITDPAREEFVLAIKSQKRLITEFVEAYVGKEKVSTFLNSVTINSYKEFVSMIKGLLPPNYASIPIDVMLQYQWQPSTGQDKTYLEIPKKYFNSTGNSHGLVFYPNIPATGGEFTRVEGIKELIYKDGEGNLHPICRTEYYMEQPWANRIGGETPVGGDSNSGSGGNGSGTGKKAGW